jgi:glycerate kinase
MLSAVPRLVAAPDKFRGTATAPEVAAAAAGAAREAGWDADEVPLADGGEGTLDAVGGEVRVTTVAGPLGAPVAAEWRLVPGAAESPGPTAVIEMARAAGRALLPRPSGDDPVRASTTGVGELVLAAARAGARRIVVGVGGSATTDGGWGAVEAIGSRGRLGGAELVVACDVRTTFRQAAEVFGPQKGATPDQVTLLGRRLDQLAERYRHELGVDVDRLPGSGAAGGLAGGLAALGASVVPGFDLVADLVGLARRLAGADLVVTGEGCLDATSFDGKVVGGVVAATGGRAPVLCVVGSTGPGGLAAVPAGAPVTVVDLSRRFGMARARSDVLDLVAGIVADRVAAAAG